MSPDPSATTWHPSLEATAATSVADRATAAPAGPPGRSPMPVSATPTGSATPVIAILDLDPAVARAVDAGLLATRLPRSLSRPLAKAIPDVT